MAINYKKLVYEDRRLVSDFTEAQMMPYYIEQSKHCPRFEKLFSCLKNRGVMIHRDRFYKMDWFIYCGVKFCMFEDGRYILLNIGSSSYSIASESRINFIEKKLNLN